MPFKIKDRRGRVGDCWARVDGLSTGMVDDDDGTEYQAPTLPLSQWSDETALARSSRYEVTIPRGLLLGLFTRYRLRLYEKSCVVGIQ